MWETQKSNQNLFENQMLAEFKAKTMLISSPNRHLNAIFGGGLHQGMITQIYGEAGSGKTQTAMLFALGAMSKNLIVGYLATQKELHFGRFTELAYSYMNEAEYEERQNYVMYKKTSDYNLGMQFIEEVLAQIKQSEKHGLLIIDSVYSFMNSCFENFNIEHDNLQKSRKQADFVNKVRWMAKSSRSAVIMINQASDNFDGRRNFSMGGNFVPALGPSWDLNMDESIEISKKGHVREIRILNSPKCKVNTKEKFKITNEGFIWISEDGVEYE